MSPPPHPSDPAAFATLLDAARRGDDAAWHDLYHQHAPAVLGYLRAQRASAPDDLLGEVWLQAVRDIHRFAGDASGFRAWLIAIAHHRLLDARRSASRRPQEQHGEQPTDTQSELAPAADAQLIAEQRLVALLGDLPDRQRTLLYMRFVLDLPLRDIAATLGIGMPAVKMLQRRSIKALQRRLAQVEGEYGPIETLPFPDPDRASE